MRKVKAGVSGENTQATSLVGGRRLRYSANLSTAYGVFLSGVM